MATKSWHDLSPRTRRLITVAAVIEGGLKALALADLARRPAAEVNGRKLVWAGALTVVSSAGILPVMYFVLGRKRQRT
jgi:hypothetical protein